MTAGSVYSVDSSALIDGLERYYPEANFPALWARVDELVAAGRFLISDEVLDEVTRKDEPAKVWCEDRKDTIVVPTDAEVISAVKDVLADYPLLVKGFKGRNRADPFVIGVGQVRSCVVVTGEGPDGTSNKPKIPYLCNELGLRCIRFTDLIREEGWQF